MSTKLREGDLGRAIVTAQIRPPGRLGSRAEGQSGGWQSPGGRSREITSYKWVHPDEERINGQASKWSLRANA